MLEINGKFSNEISQQNHFRKNLEISSCIHAHAHCNVNCQAPATKLTVGC